MKSSISKVLFSATVGCVCALSAASVSANSFDTMYQGSPDLVFNVLEQKSATTFAFTVCNQGDVSTGNGKLNVVLQSNEGQIEERTYQNTVIPAGSCLNLSMYSVDGYTTAKKRKTAVTGTVRFEGNRRELKTNNNRVVLAAKKSRVDVSEISYQNMATTTSNDPVYDLWGNSDSGVNWYAPDTSSYYNNNANSSSYYNNNTNGSYYNNGNYNNGYYVNPAGTNGNISPASPTWAMQQGNQNVVFVYTGYNTGNWYNYGPNTNGSYTYSPYNPNTNTYNSTYGNTSTSTNTYNTFESNGPTSTNTYHVFQPTSTNTNTSTNTYNTFAPGNYNSNCPQWVKVWVTSSQTYEWQCSTNYTAPTGNPDLYLANLKQNGGRSELTAKVCNQGDSMLSSRQITMRITNGNYNTTTSSFVQLLKGGCSDISIPFGNLNLNWTGGYYMLYAEVDIYDNVAETRNDNNASYWRLQIQ